MAGPGGGPPRRSHTKSRKGCKTCKRRHIRCDETFPQCRNCTKHNCRCDYNDDPPPEDKSSSSMPQPDLKWTPEIEQEIETWRETKRFPFPELNLFSPPPPQRFSTAELRLIHYICAMSRDAMMQGCGPLTIWTDKVPLFLTIASAHNFVMHALLAMSATLLAWDTKCPQTTHVAFYHRGIALKGLKDAIGDFSCDNSDAVLAGSLLLSWQALEWRSWSSLMQGTRSVIDAMDSWKHETSFPEFVSEAYFPSPAQINAAILLRSSHMLEIDLRNLQNCMNALDMLDIFLQGRKEDLKSLFELKQFVRRIHDKLPVSTPEEQFALMEPLRAWLFSLPPRFLSNGPTDVPGLLFSAHVYAVALVMEPLFPAVRTAYFAVMSASPLEMINQTLISLQGLVNAQQLHGAMSMMAYPMQLLADYRRPSIHVSSPGGGIDPNIVKGWDEWYPQYYTTSESMASLSAPITEQNISLLPQQPGLLLPSGINFENFDDNYPYSLSNFGSDYECGFDTLDDSGVTPSPRHSPSAQPSTLGGSALDYSAGFVVPALQMSPSERKMKGGYFGNIQ